MNKKKNSVQSAQPPSAPICPVSRSRAVVPLCEVGGYQVWRCPESATDFVWPIPTDAQLKQYYDRKDWFEGGEVGGYADYDSQTEFSLPMVEEILDSFAGDGVVRYVLDVGCGYGTHLALAAKRGWKCFGVELSNHARQTAIERHGDTIHIAERIDELVPHQFDLVLMLDVVEHVGNPYEFLFGLFNRGLIGPQTRLVISTPNARSNDAVVAPAAWAYRHPPSHLVYYSARSLKRLLETLLFENVSVVGTSPLRDQAQHHYEDETLGADEALSGYAGLRCEALGSGFFAFMQERYVPGTWSKLAEYEHMPRYQFARQFARDVRVLDFGCGTGYGSRFLADVAEGVVGLDIDAAALKWASTWHDSTALRFERRDDLGAGLPDACFDLITCFEMIEHVDHATQIATIDNLARLVTRTGKLIISTPNPAVTKNYGENPYHLREMDEEQFLALLNPRFSHVRIVKQWVRPSILIASEAQPATGALVTARLPTKEVVEEPPAFIAICSHESIAAIQPFCTFDSSFDMVLSETEIQKQLTGLRFENYLLNEGKGEAERRAVDATRMAAQVGEAGKAHAEGLAAQMQTIETMRDAFATQEANIQLLRDEIADRDRRLAKRNAPQAAARNLATEQAQQIAIMQSAFEQQRQTIEEMRHAFDEQAHNIEALKAELANKEDALATQATTIDSMRDAFATQEVNVEGLRGEIVDRERQLAGHVAAHEAAENNATAHVQQIAAMQGAFEQQRQTIEQMHSAFDEQAHNIEALKAELGDKENALAAQATTIEAWREDFLEQEKTSLEMRQKFALQEQNIGKMVTDFALQERNIRKLRELLAEKDIALTRHVGDVGEHLARNASLHEALYHGKQELDHTRKNLQEVSEAAAIVRAELGDRDEQIVRHTTRNVELETLLARRSAEKDQITRHYVALENTRSVRLARLLHGKSGSRSPILESTYLVAGGLIPAALKSRLAPTAATLRNRFTRKSEGEAESFKPYVIKPPGEIRASRPRVLHVIANFMTGGSSRLVVDLLEHLGGEYEQRVLTSFIPDPPNYVGADVTEIRQGEDAGRIREVIERFNPHVVHVHYWGDCDEPWYRVAFEEAHRARCKVIQNINTPVAPYPDAAIDRNVFVSRYVLEHFGDAHAHNTVVYPGSDFSLFNAVRRPGRAQRCIGMVYRLERDKLNEAAIDPFIEAARLMRGLKCLIVGGGSLLEPFKERVRIAGVEEAFEFAGYVSYQSLPALYKRMDVFVAPIWKESFGQVSAFAMNMGIPVIGYDIGAIPEIVADPSLVAPAGDSVALAAIAIRLVRDDQAREAIGVANQKRAGRMFSVEAMIGSYRDLYSELINQ